MSTVINIKYSTTTNQPADDLLTQAELAYSYSSDKLYIGYDNGTNIVPHTIGGKFFTDMLDHTAGTLTASSAIITDSNNKIDQLNVDNLTLDGNTISSTDTNGNIVLDPNGTGAITLSSNVTVTGNLTVNGTQTFTGQATFSSVNVTDLTAGEVILAGTSGELESDGAFTYTVNTADSDIDVVIDGSLDVDNILIDGNTIAVQNTNGSLTLNPDGTGQVNLGGSAGVKLPVGATADRPTGADGIIRYNTSKTQYEGYSNGSWKGLGGVIDADQDTYVTAEEGADDDTLRFYSAGNEIMTVSNANGVIIAGTHGLDVDGGITVDNIDIDGDTININGSTIQGTGNSTAGTIVLDPAPAAADAGSDVIVRGNLQVTGTTTTVESTVVSIADPVMEIGDDSTTDSLDRGISIKYNDGSAKTAFFGWDRGADNAFTFVDDGSTADARFQDLKLSGSITEVDGATPANGQILIGTGSDLTLATLTAGDSISVTNGSGSIEIDVDAATTHATTDLYDTGDGVVNYAPSGDNSGSRGAASFDSVQFNVSSGHVVIQRIEGGTF